MHGFESVDITLRYKCKNINNTHNIWYLWVCPTYCRPCATVDHSTYIAHHSALGVDLSRWPDGPLAKCMVHVFPRYIFSSSFVYTFRLQHYASLQNFSAVRPRCQKLFAKSRFPTRPGQVGPVRVVPDPVPHANRGLMSRKQQIANISRFIQSCGNFKLVSESSCDPQSSDCFRIRFGYVCEKL